MTETRHESQGSSYDLNRLRVYNILMALLHLGQAVLIIVLGWGKGLTVPITTNYLKAGGPGGMPVPTPATLGIFRLGPAIAVFLLLSATAHLVTILPGVFEWYKANLTAWHQLHPLVRVCVELVRHDCHHRRAFRHV